MVRDGGGLVAGRVEEEVVGVADYFWVEKRLRAKDLGVIGAEPEFEDEEAEEGFVMIVALGAVFGGESLDGGGVDPLVDEGGGIGEELIEFAGFGGAEPVIDDIDSEAAFFSTEEFWGEELAADFAVEPFALAVTDFEMGAELLDIFDDWAIEEGDAGFEGVSHGEFIGEHEEFFGEGGAEFEELEAGEVIEFGEGGSIGFPGVEEGI